MALKNRLLFNKTKIRSVVRNLIPARVFDFFQTYSKSSYSQEGEDLILASILNTKEKGFYIDVGAHHPLRFSNTYLFYKLGWSGINIDATPGTKKFFDKIRPRDINLECAISDITGAVKFFEFDEPALNTMDESMAKERELYTKYKVVKKTTLNTEKLGEILLKYIPKNQTIDFLTVDVEGLDLSVLKSNDWAAFQPRIVVAESLKEKDIHNILNDPIYKFMIEKKYELFAKTPRTLFFKREG